MDGGPWPLNEISAMQVVRLWVVLQGFRCSEGVLDSYSWPCSSLGTYTAKSTYDMLCQGRERVATANCTWKTYAPLKCRIFIWLALQHKVWTSDRRFRHGLQAATASCFTCLQEEDTIEHVLMQCVYARETWFRCCQLLRVAVRLPDQEDRLELWWLRERKRFKGREKKRFDKAVTLICWSIWKQRNARGVPQCPTAMFCTRASG